MSAFDGISPQALFLLSRNRLEDSKPFYEAHKEELNRTIIQPMRQLAAVFAQQVVKIDDQIMTNPVCMVSRLRRDTRFTRDKSLYRDHVWFMLMRNKNQWPNYPCMWLELTPAGYSYGVGTFQVTPAYLELLRQTILAKQPAFLAAANSALGVGASVEGEQYKRPRIPAAPPELAPYLNRKELFFMRTVPGREALQSQAIIEELTGAYAAYTPVYQFLRAVSDTYRSADKTV